MFWKIVGVVLMLVVVQQLSTPGVLIDLLILGVYYEATADSEELAEDADADETNLKKRIAALEKKLEGKE